MGLSSEPLLAALVPVPRAFTSAAGGALAGSGGLLLPRPNRVAHRRPPPFAATIPAGASENGLGLADWTCSSGSSTTASRRCHVAYARASLSASHDRHPSAPTCAKTC